MCLKRFANSSLPYKILLHANKGREFKDADRKEFADKYLLFRNLLRREDGDERILPFV